MKKSAMMLMKVVLATAALATATDKQEPDRRFAEQRRQHFAEQRRRRQQFADPFQCASLSASLALHNAASTAISSQPTYANNAESEHLRIANAPPSSVSTNAPPSSVPNNASPSPTPGTLGPDRYPLHILAPPGAANVEPVLNKFSQPVYAGLNSTLQVYNYSSKDKHGNGILDSNLYYIPQQPVTKYVFPVASNVASLNLPTIERTDARLLLDSLGQPVYDYTVNEYGQLVDKFGQPMVCRDIPGQPVAVYPNEVSQPSQGIQQSVTRQPGGQARSSYSDSIIVIDGR